MCAKHSGSSTAPTRFSKERFSAKEAAISWSTIRKAGSFISAKTSTFKLLPSGSPPGPFLNERIFSHGISISGQTPQRHHGFPLFQDPRQKAADGTDGRRDRNGANHSRRKCQPTRTGAHRLLQVFFA